MAERVKRTREEINSVDYRLEEDGKRHKYDVDCVRALATRVCDVGFWQHAVENIVSVVTRVIGLGGWNRNGSTAAGTDERISNDDDGVQYGYDGCDGYVDDVKNNTSMYDHRAAHHNSGLLLEEEMPLEVRHQKVQDFPSVEPKDPEVRLSMAKDIQILSRAQLKQQLLDRVKEKHGGGFGMTLKKRSGCVTHSNRTRSRGSKIIAFLREQDDAHVVHGDGVAGGDKRLGIVAAEISPAKLKDDLPCHEDAKIKDTKKDEDDHTRVTTYTEIESNHMNDTNEHEDMEDIVQQQMEDILEKMMKDSPVQVVLSPQREDMEDEISLANMLEQLNSVDGVGQDEEQVTHELCSPPSFGSRPTDACVFLDPFYEEEALDVFSPALPAMVVGHHIPDLSPEERVNMEAGIRKDDGEAQVELRSGTKGNNSVAKLRQDAESSETRDDDGSRRRKYYNPDSGFRKPSRRFSRKSVPRSDDEDENRDVSLVRLREVILNAKLAEHWKQGQSWARLDIFGVELSKDMDYEEVKVTLLDTLKSKYAEDLEQTVQAIEEEWVQLKRVRQKYSSDCTPQKADAPRSILKRTSPAGVENVRSEGGTLRWAKPVKINHQYHTDEDCEPVKPNPDGSNQLHHSSRGLRMLLASACVQPFPKGGLPSPHSSPPLTYIEDSKDFIDSAAFIPTSMTNRRSRIPNTGASKGQRLLMALQQAATDQLESSAVLHNMDAPKSLSTTLT